MRRRELSGERGQAGLFLVAVLAAALVGALVLGGVARGVGVQGERQRAADLGALAGAKAMHAAYSRLFEAGSGQLSRSEYTAIGTQAATETARRNGATEVDVEFPDGDTFAPVRIAVTVSAGVRVGERTAPARARAEAELSAPATPASLPGGGDEYSGPLETRQGKPMRADVARAFDRMSAEARADGVALIIASGFRSNAEQAALFAARPDPRWVAPPGKSLHRLGTELDLAPPAAYGWLAAHAGRFGFVQRYDWEPWHFGFTRSPGTRSLGFGPGDGQSGLPGFVPAQFAAPISRAAQRWNVGAALLAAQLYAESNFNPFAQSAAGARGIAQFMPATARAYGVANPYDAGDAIDGQARLMRDLLERFGSVPLALAAYSAGPAPVSACGCIPAIAETQGYVARILGLLGGAGDAPPGGGLEVRLVK